MKISIQESGPLEVFTQEGGYARNGIMIDDKDLGKLIKTQIEDCPEYLDIEKVSLRLEIAFEKDSIAPVGEFDPLFAFIRQRQ